MRKIQSKFLVIIGMGLLMAFTARGENILLFDFEDSVEGWENESGDPVVPQLVSGNARHGAMALGFEYSFSARKMILHCRVKEGFPRDCSKPEFKGFSAWIYIPNGKAKWEAKMFVRSNPDWVWKTGKTLKNLGPGWTQIRIMRGEIEDVSQIQDIGFEVINYTEEITSLILVDKVEMIMANAAEPSR